MNDLPSQSAHDQGFSALLSLGIEAWRFSKVFLRAVGKLDADEQTRFISQCRYFLKEVEDTLAAEGYRFVNLEGHPFDPGMAANAINLSDFFPR